MTCLLNAGIDPILNSYQGSTGTLGCYILDLLYKRPDVKKIYALNRPGRSSGVGRQKESLIDRGLDPALVNDPRVECLDVNLEQDRFGLSEVKYNEIRDSVTIIMHNAWRLDFNLSLPSFEVC